MNQLSKIEEEELRILCDALVDECISPADHEKLDRWIVESTAAAAFYVEHTKLCAALHVYADSLETGDHVQPISSPAKKPLHRKNPVTPALQIAAAIALLLFAVSALGYFLRKGNLDDAIARLEFVSPDAEFSASHQLPRIAGRSLDKGWIFLEQGELRIRFQSGATVELEGPAAFGIDSPMRSYLDYGHIRVHAPESARDFVVATESVEVVDLGTRFELDVDLQSRESNVSVIEGLVDLHLGSRGTKRKIQPLDAGSAARVDAFGKIVEITNGPANQSKPEDDSPRLLGRWTFDELSADGKLADSTENELDASLVNGQTSNLVPGVSGNALRLSGHEFVDLSEHVSTLGQLGDFTFTAWVRNPGKPLAMLFSLSGESEQQRVQILVFRQHINFGWQNGPHYDAISGRINGWERERWYHVAVTREKNRGRLYRDGELIASGSVGSKIGTPVSSPSQLKNVIHSYLGRLHDGRQGSEVSAQGFEGQMDDVQFYSGALEQEAIQSIYEHPGEPWKPNLQRKQFHQSL